MKEGVDEVDMIGLDKVEKCMIRQARKSLVS